MNVVLKKIERPKFVLEDEIKLLPKVYKRIFNCECPVQKCTMMSIAQGEINTSFFDINKMNFLKRMKLQRHILDRLDIIYPRFLFL